MLLGTVVAIFVECESFNGVRSCEGFHGGFIIRFCSDQVGEESAYVCEIWWLWFFGGENENILVGVHNSGDPRASTEILSE